MRNHHFSSLAREEEIKTDRARHKTSSEIFFWGDHAKIRKRFLHLGEWRDAAFCCKALLWHSEVVLLSLLGALLFFLQSQFIEHIVMLGSQFIFHHMIHKCFIVLMDSHKEPRCELAFKKNFSFKCLWIIDVK